MVVLYVLRMSRDVLTTASRPAYDYVSVCCGKVILSVRLAILIIYFVSRLSMWECGIVESMVTAVTEACCQQTGNDDGNP